MSNSLAKSRQSMPLNSIDRRMAKASIAINRPNSSEEIDAADEAVSLVFQALADIGMSDKEAAYTMAIDPAQLSRVKSRQQGLAFDRMWRLPANFWLAFGARLNEAKRLTPESARELKAARIAELLRLILEVSA